MAKNKVEIDVKVDDKGSTKKMALNSKKAGEGLDSVAKGARTADRNTKGVANTSANASKNFSKMSQGMGGLVGAYATFAASVFALSAAFNFLKNAADIAQLEASQVSFAQNTGVQMSSLTTQLRSASKGMLDFQAAAEASAIGVAKGFSAGQMNEIASGALAVSNVLGRNFTDSFDRLVRGISKAEPELLDELGITLRLETATKAYADSLGVAADSLSTADKSQAVYLETMKQLEMVTAGQEGVENPFVKLGATFSDIAKAVSGAILPPLKFLANFLNENAAAAALFFGAIGISIIKNMPFIGDMKNSITNFFNTQDQKAIQAQKTLDNYKNKLKEIKQTIDQTRAKGETGMQSGAKKALKQGGGDSPVLQRAAAGTMKGADKTNLKKALDSYERQMKKSGKVTTGIFKGVSQKVVQDISRSMKMAEAKTKKSTFGMRRAMKRFSLETTRAAAVIRKKLAPAMTMAGKAAKRMGKAMNMAMKATVILGVIQMIYDLIMTIVNAPTKILGAIGAIAKGILNVFGFIVNGIITAINFVIGNVQKIPFVGDKIDKIAPFDTKNIKEGIDGLVKAGNDKLGFTAYEEKRQQGLQDTETLNSVKDDARSGAAELAKTMQGEVFDKTSPKFDPTKFGVAAANAIKTSNIEQLMSNALTIKDSGKQEKAFEAIAKSFGDMAELSPTIGKALDEKNFTGKGGVKELIGDARRMTNNIEGANTKLADMGTTLKGATALGVKLFAEDLNKMGTAATESAEKLGLTTDIKAKIDEKFAEKGGLDAYIATLTELETRAQTIADTKNNLAIDKAGAVGTPKLFQEQQQADFAARSAVIALSEKQLELDNHNALLKSTMSAEEKENHATKVAHMEREIELAEKVRDVTQEQTDELTRAGQKLGDTLSSGMAKAFQSIVDGTMDAKQAFGSMAQTMLQMMAKLVAEALAMQALKFLFPAGSSMGDFLGIHNRYGGVMSDGKKVSGYSAGGVAKGRDSGYPAILHGTEAIVPLPNGKSIPVDMQGQQGSVNNVVVNVSNEGQTSVESKNGPGSENLGRAIASAVQKELQNQKRSGGILSPYGAA